MRSYIATLFTLIIFGIPAISTHFAPQVDAIAHMFSNVTGQFASAILYHNPKTVAEIKSHYDNASAIPGFITSKVRVLISPGHEPTYGGAEYNDIKERYMAVELGQDLQGFLNADPHYQSFITRDNQDWKPDFAAYFKDKWDEINQWQVAAWKENNHLVSIGSTTRAVGAVKHNAVPLNVALRLFGITKWANDNSIDITIHIHFNDNPGHPLHSPGTHSGFTIYVPAAQYANSTTTRAVADAVYKRLAKYNPVSDLHGESSGVVEDPDLIAIGANNTSNDASMLIEYGYIYEPQFNNPQIYSTALKDLAYQTYLGLEDFFDKKSSDALANSYDTLILPYKWTNPITLNKSGNDVYALQTALAYDGVYPPDGETKNDCPRTGMFGPCTKNSLTVFQQKHGVDGEVGKVGEKTLNVLNSLYSARSI